MRKTSPTVTDPQDPWQSGFTLFEMLVVLTIMSLLVGLAARQMGAHGGSASRESLARLQALMEEKRSRALRSGNRESVNASDLADTALAIEGNAGNSISWYPDGSATGGKVIRKERTLVTVDPLTGSVRSSDR